MHLLPLPVMDKVLHAVNTLKNGGIIAYPTEAVWGLGCDPDNLDAVKRLLHLKQRPVEKGLILIAAAWDQLAPYLLALDTAMAARVLPTWPGPVTWLLPAKATVPPELRGNHDTLAVRVTDHPQCMALCRQWGKPVVSTSANPAGKDPAYNLQQVQAYFGTQVDYYLPGNLGPQQMPSEIRDGRTGEIVRPSVKY